MATATGPRVFLYADRAALGNEVRAPLESAGLAIDDLAANNDERRSWDQYGLVVVAGGRPLADDLAFCRQVRAEAADQPPAILILLSEPTAEARRAVLESGADAYLPRPFHAAELLAQVRALLQQRELQLRLRDKTAEAQQLTRRLHQAHQQMKQESELAQRLQRSFAPRRLPDAPGVKIAVRTHSGGHIGGDFYDVFRLDERHVGVYLADAMGHSVTASLLTLFLKASLLAKEITGTTYRLIPPDQVLHQLNHALRLQALDEDPFVTMVYFLVNGHERSVQLARAGHPAPLYVPCGGEPTLWQAPGSFLGVFDTPFPLQRHPLHVGDKVVLYTDGMGLPRNEVHGGEIDLLLECARRHRALPIDAFIDQLHHELCPLASQEDFTLLGWEMVEAGPNSHGACSRSTNDTIPASPSL